MGGTDRAWESYGSTAPYYGVLTDERYLGRSLDEATRAAFFDTGKEHVAETLAALRRCVAPDFAPTAALDFGCGVGRIAIPLARECQRVVGVDISPSMLAEARLNAEQAGVTNVEFVESDDALTRVSGTFDLIHTTIVMQHVPPRGGYRILEALLDRLRPGGVGVIHVTYSSGQTVPREIMRRARTTVPLVRILLNLLRGRSARTPIMQMNAYDLGRVFALVQEAGSREVLVQFTDHGFRGATLYFRTLIPHPAARAPKARPVCG